MRKLLIAALLCTSTPSLAAVDLKAIDRITDQAFNHGEAARTAAYLADQIGPRLTNSPGMRRAERWTQERLRDWGLSNVRTEAFEFGRGWSVETSHVRMVSPRSIDLRAAPIAWTPGTPGELTAPVVVAPMSNAGDFDQWRGKLAGKIVLVSNAESPEDATEAPFSRLSNDDIAKLDVYQQPVNFPTIEARFARARFATALDAFLKSENAVAWARVSDREAGLLSGIGSRYRRGDTPLLPAVEIGAEDYRRIVRLADSGGVTLSIDSRVTYDDSDPMARNVFADLIGRDAKAGYVMAGAHLDSWATADGASDNAAGVAIVMEAARILSRLGVKPKRTIRFALWAAEEQGQMGSGDYVDRHLVTRPRNPDPAMDALGYRYRTNQYPILKKPGYDELAGYFNLDHGPGKIRGIYAEGNFAAVPILKEWLTPLASLGASSVVIQPTPWTDHEFMARAGLPAFQFIQDPLDYLWVTHHSSADTFDHLRGADLQQAAAVLASVLLSAANADEPLPTTTIPTKPGAD